MVSVIVLAIAFAAGLIGGWLGVQALNTSEACMRWALAAMFAFTGISHFTPMRHDFAKMVPRLFPQPMAMVYFTGLCEIAGAIGLLLPNTRRIAAICLVLLLAALFPANVRASRENIALGGRAPTPLPLRAAVQLMFVLLVLWSTRF